VGGNTGIEEKQRNQVRKNEGRGCVRKAEKGEVVGVIRAHQAEDIW
jgi:hypothetical protein